MFDTVTEQLIQEAPPLEGLDLEALPRQLTDAYAELVSARVRLRSTGAFTAGAELSSLLARLSRLSETYEAYVHLLPSSERRVSAAYVAASAYKILATADPLLGRELRAPKLTGAAISHSVAATVLFLISGYSAEAAEILPAVSSTHSHATPGAALLAAVASLARGRLDRIQSLQWESPTLESGEEEAVAVEFAWEHLLLGVRDLAGELLGDPDGGTAEAYFRRVFDLTSESTLGLTPDQPVGSLPGPHHLAALLLQVAPALRATALVNVPSPDADGGVWTEFVRRTAHRRPYLWPGHIRAIESGYLRQGVSAVVSFPTGAGKSCVAELRIAASLGRSGRTVYLAPTHALVNQIRSDLEGAFPDATVTSSLIDTAEYSEVDDEITPDVMVMTPERCLTLLGIDEEPFTELDTVIFDECHLLHPRDSLEDRRALDATLCLLRLITVATRADLLLMSAMMANAKELSEWLSRVLGRSTMPIEVTWKPVRQVRGCVVFPTDEIFQLRELLAAKKPDAEAAKRRKVREAISQGKAVKSMEAAVPKAVKDELRATPHALFSLRSTWATKSSDDYAFLKLSEEKVHLSANKFWKLTPNRNVVASHLAGLFAEGGLKTLVFAQDRKSCESIANNVSETLAGHYGNPSSSLLEESLLEAIAEELGGSEHTFADPNRRAASHHGLLLPLERQFNESAFKREDGVRVLCATSTLAQGMNLPAEAVIIAGDDRFNPESGRAELLKAHELLNAAGRAGRAGHQSQGVVLLIPGEVVPIDHEKNTIGSRWIELQEELFSKSDHCLDIGDPLEALVDHIANQRLERGLIEYFFCRLPVDEDGTVNDKARKMLNRSLAAYKAGSSNAFTAQVERLLKVAQDRRATQHVPTWQATVAASTGVHPAIISSIANRLALEGPPNSVAEAADWTLAWMREDPGSHARAFFRDASLAAIHVNPPESTAERAAWLTGGLERFGGLLTLWIRGEPLVRLEEHIGHGKDPGKLITARKFVMDAARDFSYAVGVVAQVARASEAEAGSPTPSPALVSASTCVREGFNHPVQLAIFHTLPTIASRVRAHRAATELGNLDELGDLSLQDLRARVKTLNRKEW